MNPLPWILIVSPVLFATSKRASVCYWRGRHEVDFPKDDGMRFHNGNLPLHENGMQIHARHDDTVIYSKTYYSIGGGFIVDEEHFGGKRRMRLLYLIRLNRRKKCWSIATVPAFHSPAW